MTDSKAPDHFCSDDIFCGQTERFSETEPRLKQEVVGSNLSVFPRKQVCLLFVFVLFVTAMVHRLHEGGVRLADGQTGPAAPHVPAENTHQNREGKEM